MGPLIWVAGGGWHSAQDHFLCFLLKATSGRRPPPFADGGLNGRSGAPHTTDVGLRRGTYFVQIHRVHGHRQSLGALVHERAFHPIAFGDRVETPDGLRARGGGLWGSTRGTWGSSGRDMGVIQGGGGVPPALPQRSPLAFMSCHSYTPNRSQANAPIRIRDLRSPRRGGGG